MKINELQQTASNLYEDGWRSTDREDLIKEYHFTKDEADKIVNRLLAHELDAQCIPNLEEGDEIPDDMMADIKSPSMYVVVSTTKEAEDNGCYANMGDFDTKDLAIAFAKIEATKEPMDGDSIYYVVHKNIVEFVFVR